MKTKTPSQLRENDCVVFTHKGEHTVRRIIAIEHDERFATPGGSGDLYRVTFEVREGVTEFAEYPPHVEVDVLTEQDLAAVMAAGIALVQRFVVAAVPAVQASLDELARYTPDQFREVLERGKATRA